MNNLKQCPFCGGPARFVRIPDGDDASGEFIECIDCHVSTPILFPCMDSVKQLLIEKWNHRQAKKVTL